MNGDPSAILFLSMEDYGTVLPSISESFGVYQVKMHTFHIISNVTILVIIYIIISNNNSKKIVKTGMKIISKSFLHFL